MQLENQQTITHRACAFKGIGLDSFAFNFDSLVLVREQTAGYVRQIIHHLRSKHRLSSNSEGIEIPAGPRQPDEFQKRDQHQADNPDLSACVT